MLTVFGVAIIAVLLLLILFRIISALVALILMPLVGGLAAGAAVARHRIGPRTARIGHTRRDLQGGVVVELRQLAHTRCGDKGNTANVSIVSYDRADYPRLVRDVTVERVKEHLAGLVQGEIERYELPALGALNFVLHEALGGGVTRSLAFDRHGKSLSSAFLTLKIPDAE